MKLPFSGAVFDLDGTLFDSTHAWQTIDRTFLERRGIVVPTDYMEKLGALSLAEAAHYTINRFGFTQQPADIIAEWKTLGADFYTNQVCLKPHALAYLQALQAAGIPMAVATGLPDALSHPALKRVGIFAYFTAICSVDHVRKGKNFPDVFLLAAEKLGQAPQNCIAFDDVLDAVKSAKQAGFTVFAVKDEHPSQCSEKLVQAADYFIQNMAEAPLPA